MASPRNVGVAVLRNDGGHALGMGHGQAEPGRSAVVEYLERVAIEPDHLGEAADDLGKIIEAIRTPLGP